MKTLKPFFLIVDIGFIIYWVITLMNVIPPEYLFKDYDNEILSAWNWSFLPLDLFISITGLLSIYFWKNKSLHWKPLALISLVLTFASGIQAISFWALRGDFDLSWWTPNLFLLIYPLFFIKGIVKEISGYDTPKQA
ncbi:MAG: YvaD family protein [Fibrobacterales bacterium]